MKAYTYKDLEDNLRKIVDEVINDVDEAVIALGEGKAVVIVPMETWESMKAQVSAVRQEHEAEADTWIPVGHLIAEIRKLAVARGVQEEK